MRILVVDDDAMAGELTGAVLEELGHEVILAADGLEAQGKLDGEGGIDVILSDMNMPLVSGLDLFRALRDQGCAVPFILLTGDAPERFLALEPRLDACLFKDDTLEETLPAVLTKVLGGSAGS
jgi:CheY-like chemotaxis protein